jgi:hypothetical protein
MLRYRTPIRQAAALARRLGAGRNPLCRRSDRIQATVTLVGIALVLAAAGLGIGAGQRAAADQTRRAGHEQATRHVATAVLVEPAGTSTSSVVPVKARWHTGHGVRTGTITAHAGLPAGARVHIWITRTGTPTTEPLTVAAARINGVAFGLAVPAGAVLVALLGVRLVRYRLDRRRLADWADGWVRVEPQWTRRRTQ